PAVDERRRSTAVQIDGVMRPERDHQLSKLVERQAGIDVRPTTIAGDRDELIGCETQRRARVSPHGDVRVELIRGRANALDVIGVRDEPPALHEQRSGLQEVARRSGWKLVSAADPDVSALDRNRGSNGAERVMYRD